MRRRTQEHQQIPDRTAKRRLYGVLNGGDAEGGRPFGFLVASLLVNAPQKAENCKNSARFLPIGPEEATVRSPTQMAVFEKSKAVEAVSDG